MHKLITLAALTGYTFAFPCGDSACGNSESSSTGALQATASASSTSSASASACNKVGEYTCIGDDTAVCNVDLTWSITPCGSGMKCLPNDWECVPLSEWDQWNRTLNAPKPKPVSTSSILQAPKPTPTPKKIPCTKVGEYTCLGNDTAVCNVDKFWSVTACQSGTKCMPNDWECVPLSMWNSLNKTLNAPKPKPKPVSTSHVLQAPKPTPTPQKIPCTKVGEYSCIGNDTAVCNVDKFWSITTCGEGMKCMPNDWECVPLYMWNGLNKTLNAPKPKPVSTSRVLQAPKPTPTPQKIPCSKVGEYSCIGNDSAVCNVDGFWSITACQSGTKCMPNDWECVPLSMWNSLNKTLNAPKPKPISSSRVLQAPKSTPTPQKVPCTKLGEYTCIGNDTAVCNVDGFWSITACQSGTKCMPNDWECVPLSQWHS